MLFTRYPEAGSTKTRLIPHLGAVRAAELQRWMTASMVQEMTALCPEIDRQIHFSGGGLSQMQAWLGRQLTYVPQLAGSLGNRLHQAFVENFRLGMKAVVAIGSDCPELSARHLEQAFRQLQTHDVVLGPAADGGYYLIGLSGAQAKLFETIPWGTGQVFERTVAIATSLNLSIATLEELRDVDRPEDLELLKMPICI
ncbi:TIGR04282 family arsenosugar biosynthesis glycosyltransferase [Leptolyngbya cf. ectocarpi LEGE 11479]|uniref:TIGR04282 family arsenosugar biosynthesis glycosyltransferase n=1 Tax=Leptolyngbya cf. ectocarpi LEGE 11479 TaxID=1828722 RepID=A0A928ZZQ4_LEPEC|nr:TIGR04282 family arsenosugar biosynthesis glycosyltransferase [Leptolyngbya ectocarpi]MBE9070489.1 TIGR04282 family arsenosugar biosynthesis glycosyltransferase [Leptolyngbya cf. ectocarpi LEGE 11479]